MQCLHVPETITENGTTIFERPEIEEELKDTLIEAQMLIQQLRMMALYKYSRESFTCRTAGQFSRYGASDFSQRYFDCRWIPTVYRCPTGREFDKKTNKCEKIINHDNDSNVKKWEHLIQCKAEGNFKSPYNCHYFYQCQPNHPLSTGDKFIVKFKKCQDGLVYNEENDACDYSHKTKCRNAPIPAPDHQHDDHDHHHDQHHQHSTEQNL